MSSHHKDYDVAKIVTSTGDFVSASDGGRNLLMECDDIAFINKDSQAAEKDNIKLNPEEQQQGLPRLELDEHIGVQLRFDSLNEPHILLEDHSQKEAHWGPDFSRGDNGVLGLEAASQNIEFGSSASKPCTISRHFNVWSEATSSESVQMLLNSVGQDEVGMITKENVGEGSDTCELVHSSKNQVKFSMSENVSTPSEVGADERKTMHAKIQPGFGQAGMDMIDDNRQLPSFSEGTGSQQHYSSSDIDNRAENDACVPATGSASDRSKLELDNSGSLVNSLPDMDPRQPVNIESDRSCEAEGSESHIKGVEQQQDEWLSSCKAAQETKASHDETEMGDGKRGKMTESSRGMEILYNEAGQYTAVSGSSHQVHGDFGQKDFQQMAVPILGESNEDNAGKPGTEVIREDVVQSEMQGMPASLLDESKEKAGGKHSPLEDPIVADLQGSSASLLGNTGDHHSIASPEAVVSTEVEAVKHAPEPIPEDALASEVQGMLALSLDESNREAEVKHSSWEDSAVMALQGRSESLMDEHEDDAGRHPRDASQEAVVSAEVQRLSESVLIESNDKVAGKHATGASQEDAVVGDIEGVDESNDDKAGKLATETSQGVAELEEIQEISDPLPDEKHEDNAGKHDDVTKVSQQHAILGQKQAISDLAVDDSSQDNAEKHVSDASLEGAALVEMQGIPDPSLGDESGGKHLTEASQEDIVVAYNGEKIKREGEQSILGTDKRLFDPGLPLQEKTLAQDGSVLAKAIMLTEAQEEGREQGVPVLLSEAELMVDEDEKGGKTEANCVSGEDVCIAGNSKFTSIDTEAGQDVSSCVRARQIDSDCQAKASEASELVQISSSLGDSSFAPASCAMAGSTDSIAPGILEVVGEISEIPSNFNLTVERTTASVMQHANAGQQSVKSLFVDPLSSQNEPNQKDSSITHEKRLFNNVTPSSAADGPEKCLENDNYSTQKESAAINERSNQESLSRDDSCVFSIEAGQNQENERKEESVMPFLPPTGTETMVEVTASPCSDLNSEMKVNNPVCKSTTLISGTGQETSDHSISAASVQRSNASTLSVEKVMSEKCQQALHTIDSSITIEDDHAKHANLMNEEFGKTVKEGHASFDVKVQDTRNTKAALFSDEQQCILATDSAEVSMQTNGKVHHSDIPESKGVEEAGKTEQEMHAIAIAESENYTEKTEKDEGKFEAMEVSIEVGIPLEPDNDSTSMDGDGKHLEAAVLLADDDKSSAGQMNSGRSGEVSFESKHGDDKADNVETEIQNLEVKSASQTDDTFTFKVGTKNILSGKSIDVSAEFPSSGLLDKNARSWKPFQTSHSIEVVKNNASDSCKTGEGQSRAFQENANANSTMKATVPDMYTKVQEGNAGRAMAKAKSMPDIEKGRQMDTVKELEKKSRSHNPKLAAGACSASIGSGNYSISIGAREEQKSSGAGAANASSKCHLSTAVQTATLPDLNATVVPASVLFQQPFTDSQQVQLRAQILVYGSLIQGSLPEEALMETAFTDIGGASHNGTLSDGGRSVWENAWHYASERIHRKAFANSSDMPSYTSCSSTPSVLAGKIVEGMKTPSSSAVVNVTDSRNSPILGLRSADLAVSRSHSSQTRVGATPNMGRVGSKNTSAAIMSPPRPVTLSSPIWGMSTPVNDGMPGSNIPRTLHLDPHQMSPARHLFQSPQLGHYPPQGNTSRLSHPPFPGPWMAPPQATLSESGLPFSTFVVPEVTQETPNNRRSSVPIMPLASPFSSMAGAGTVQAGTNANKDVSKGGIGVRRQSNSEQKSRKRKKNRLSEEIVRTSGLTPSGVEVTSVTNVSTRPNSTTASTVSVNPAQEVYASGNLSTIFVTGTSTPNISSISRYQIISRGEPEQRIIFSEETSSRIEQAKLSAEDAASAAATAVRHSQAIWGQLGAQKNTGLVSDREAKLASAAVAAAAAASVAKAAAAAAKVAYDAAVQAKFMAAEALNGDNKMDANHSGEVGLLEGGQGQATSTLASNLKGREKVATSSWQMREDCHSIIAAAREAAKKRVEAASAATKRAQNLDAVVRAAELAAEAVSQAGAVVAMGDPIPLSLNTLAEAGAEGYWKLPNQGASNPQKHADVQNEIESPQEVATVISEKSAKHLKSRDKRDAFKKEMSRNTNMKGPTKESSRHVDKDGTQTSDGACHDTIPLKKDMEVRKENQVVGAVQSAVSVPGTEAGTREEVVAPEAEPVMEIHKETMTPKANEIKEGSFVEVVSDEEGLRGVWFSAKVLSLKDGKAFVRYDELLSDEGPGQLQEWIPLEGEHGKAPRIRMAHPMTVIKFEGTRKRRRAAMGNYIWSVGDRVDAWIRDGWWEGIVKGKSEDDETKLTVYFPGEGDTTIIKAWNLRPSLVWKDGQWVEWTILKAEKDAQHEDDIPLEKRQKLDKHDTEVKATEKLQKIPNVEEGKKLQELNAVVKMSTEGTNSTNIKVNRPDLQKEGSKVICGVPKPAKKRKFMDVSKHYVADRMARNSPEGKSSSRFDKYKALVSHSHSGWKTTNKVEDKRTKRPMISKPKELKSWKVQDEQSKTKTGKDKSSVGNATASKEILGHDLVMSGTSSTTIDGSKVGRRAVMAGGHVPSSQKSGDAHISKDAVTHRPSPSTKVKGSSATESEQGSKGKQSSASDTSSLNVEKPAFRQEVTKDRVSVKTTTDNMEPRRSNRRIQPTSRLLEGLQSSPNVVKSSSSSFLHEKGGKIQQKTSSSIPKGNAAG